MRTRINQLFWFQRNHFDFWIGSNDSKIVDYDLHPYVNSTILVLEKYKRYPLRRPFTTSGWAAVQNNKYIIQYSYKIEYIVHLYNIDSN